MEQEQIDKIKEEIIQEDIGKISKQIHNLSNGIKKGLITNMCSIVMSKWKDKQIKYLKDLTLLFYKKK